MQKPTLLIRPARLTKTPNASLTIQTDLRKSLKKALPWLTFITQCAQIVLMEQDHREETARVQKEPLERCLAGSIQMRFTEHFLVATKH